MRAQPLFFLCLALLSCIFGTSSVAAQDSTQATPPPASVNPVFYGGTIGFNFSGDFFRISLQPYVGYKFTDRVSAGVKVGYEYTQDKSFDPALVTHSVGASVFGRYRIIPQAYAHAEFAGVFYRYKIADFASEKQFVPFILLGGGFIQPLSRSTAFILEVLFDVLQDDKSPYEPWTPWISIGVAVNL